MDLLLGYHHAKHSKPKEEKLVCHLHKSIYGLKQASHQWYSKFSHALLQCGFTQSKSNYSLITKGSSSSFVALLMYVDDIILTGPNITTINSLKGFLHSRFKLKDLSSLRYFLGLELARSSRGIVLSRCHYTLQFLEDMSYLACKTTTIPKNPKLKLTATQGTLLPDGSVYRRLIGWLLYLTFSHHDHLCCPSS